MEVSIDILMLPKRLKAEICREIERQKKQYTKEMTTLSERNPEYRNMDFGWSKEPAVIEDVCLLLASSEEETEYLLQFAFYDPKYPKRRICALLPFLFGEEEKELREAAKEAAAEEILQIFCK